MAMELTIVGMGYKPPAATIFKFLPKEVRLILVPEPTNAHDPNAIKVYVSREIIDEMPRREQLRTALASDGVVLGDLLSGRKAFQIGYVARDEAATLKNKIVKPVSAVFKFS
jgi:hypothetical protein